MGDHTAIEVLNLSDAEKRRLADAQFRTIGSVNCAIEDGSIQRVDRCGPEFIRKVQNAIKEYESRHRTAVSDERVQKAVAVATEKEKDRENARNVGKKTFWGAILAALITAGALFWSNRGAKVAPDPERESHVETEKRSRDELIPTTLQPLQFSKDVFISKLREAREGGGSNWASFRDRYKGKYIANWTCYFNKVLDFGSDENSASVDVELFQEPAMQFRAIIFVRARQRLQELNDLKRGARIGIVIARIAQIYDDGTIRLSGADLQLEDGGVR